MGMGAAMKTFRCAMCKREFEQDSSDEEAAAEYARDFAALGEVDTDVVCDPCYRQMIAEYPPSDFVADQKAGVERRLGPLGSNPR
jgi:DNA-directed RNA polymerase subunit RPC12/RpoP